MQLHRHCINDFISILLVILLISFEKGVSSSEDVPADTANDTPSETFADEHAPEDASEPSAKGVPGTKKDVPPPKAVSDGKLVKGMVT